SKLWKMRVSIFFFFFLQVLLTGGLFTMIGILAGLPFAASYIAGFGLALSSTAFAMQILEENRQLKTTHGQGAFSVLMFQDIAVVPLLASLAFFTSSAEASASGLSWLKVLNAFLVILGLVVVGRFVIRKVFRWVADTGIQEVFIAMSLLVVVGTGLLLQSIGLSMGLGAFVAGVLLAESEYRHELETNLMPFKGLLLGLFFIAVGMSLDLKVLLNHPFLILGLGIGFMALKSLIIFMLAKLFKFPTESSRNMAFTITQGGEFAFVLFSTAMAQGLLSGEHQSLLSASVTLSMALTPFAFNFNQKYLRRSSEVSERPFDEVNNGEVEVIIAGYGRFGQIVSRFLKAQGVSYTVLEHSASQVDVARSFGNKIFYGDASREEILEQAGAKTAKYFVLAIDDPEKSIET
ncbi:MAG: cation:proton antiporter, partial [Bdellovibrionales bacterium]|nr:cation:proton antiporter [Bdellovibrionales bacterium]